jgi:large subunit ribosomal protein L17
MRHGRTGKKLGRDASHRKALYANLACSLFEHGRIRTTEAKAKAVKPYAEKMITLARRGDLHARRQALAQIKDADQVTKLFDVIGPRYKGRPGGYTRVLKAGFRHGDNAPMAIIEFIDRDVDAKGQDSGPVEVEAEAEA